MRVCCRCGVQITADPRYVMCPGCAAWAERHASRLSEETGAELSADEVAQPSPVTAADHLHHDCASAADLRRATYRANTLADECGRLRDENRELLVENARLRRALEKAGRR